MAYMKKYFDVKGFLFLVLLTIPSKATTNIDCHGKAFNCVNSTHFMICVDLGTGISTTIDDVIIPCPRTTACRPTNRYECEFPAPSIAELEGNTATDKTKSEVITIIPLITTQIPFEEYFDTIASSTISESEFQSSTISSILPIESNTTIQNAPNMSTTNESKIDASEKPVTVSNNSVKTSDAYNVLKQNNILNLNMIPFETTTVTYEEESITTIEKIDTWITELPFLKTNDSSSTTNKASKNTESDVTNLNATVETLSPNVHISHNLPIETIAEMLSNKTKIFVNDLKLVNNETENKTITLSDTNKSSNITIKSRKNIVTDVLNIFNINELKLNNNNSTSEATTVKTNHDISAKTDQVIEFLEVNTDNYSLDSNIALTKFVTTEANVIKASNYTHPQTNTTSTSIPDLNSIFSASAIDLTSISETTTENKQMYSAFPNPEITTDSITDLSFLSYANDNKASTLAPDTITENSINNNIVKINPKVALKDVASSTPKYFNLALNTSKPNIDLNSVLDMLTISEIVTKNDQQLTTLQPNINVNTKIDSSVANNITITSNATFVDTENHQNTSIINEPVIESSKVNKDSYSSDNLTSNKFATTEEIIIDVSNNTYFETASKPTPKITAFALDSLSINDTQVMPNDRQVYSTIKSDITNTSIITASTVASYATGDQESPKLGMIVNSTTESAIPTNIKDDQSNTLPSSNTATNDIVEINLNIIPNDVKTAVANDLNESIINRNLHSDYFKSVNNSQSISEIKTTEKAVYNTSRLQVNSNATIDSLVLRNIKNKTAVFDAASVDNIINQNVSNINGQVNEYSKVNIDSYGLDNIPISNFTSNSTITYSSIVNNTTDDNVAAYSINNNMISKMIANVTKTNLNDIKSISELNVQSNYSAFERHDLLSKSENATRAEQVFTTLGPEKSVNATSQQSVVYYDNNIEAPEATTVINVINQDNNLLFINDQVTASSSINIESYNFATTEAIVIDASNSPSQQETTANRRKPNLNSDFSAPEPNALSENLTRKTDITVNFTANSIIAINIPTDYEGNNVNTLNNETSNNAAINLNAVDNEIVTAIEGKLYVDTITRKSNLYSNNSASLLNKSLVNENQTQNNQLIATSKADITIKSIIDSPMNSNTSNVKAITSLDNSMAGNRFNNNIEGLNLDPNNTTTATEKSLQETTTTTIDLKRHDNYLATNSDPTMISDISIRDKQVLKTAKEEITTNDKASTNVLPIKLDNIATALNDTNRNFVEMNMMTTPFDVTTTIQMDFHGVNNIDNSSITTSANITPNTVTPMVNYSSQVNDTDSYPNLDTSQRDAENINTIENNSANTLILNANILSKISQDTIVPDHNSEPTSKPEIFIMNTISHFNEHAIDSQKSLESPVPDKIIIKNNILVPNISEDLYNKSLQTKNVTKSEPVALASSAILTNVTVKLTDSFTKVAMSNQTYDNNIVNDNANNIPFKRLHGVKNKTELPILTDPTNESLQIGPSQLFVTPTKTKSSPEVTDYLENTTLTIKSTAMPLEPTIMKESSAPLLSSKNVIFTETLYVLPINNSDGIHVDLNTPLNIKENITAYSVQNISSSKIIPITNHIETYLQVNKVANDRIEISTQKYDLPVDSDSNQLIYVNNNLIKNDSVNNSNYLTKSSYATVTELNVAYSGKNTNYNVDYNLPTVPTVASNENNIKMFNLTDTLDKQFSYSEVDKSATYSIPTPPSPNAHMTTERDDSQLMIQSVNISNSQYHTVDSKLVPKINENINSSIKYNENSHNPQVTETPSPQLVETNTSENLSVSPTLNPENLLSSQYINASDVVVSTNIEQQNTHAGIMWLQKPPQKQNDKSDNEQSEDKETPESELDNKSESISSTYVRNISASLASIDNKELRNNSNTREELLSTGASNDFDMYGINKKELTSVNISTGKNSDSYTKIAVDQIEKETPTYEFDGYNKDITNDTNTSTFKPNDQNKNKMYAHSTPVISNDQSSTFRYVSQTKPTTVSVMQTEFPIFESTTPNSQTNIFTCQHKIRGRYADQLDCRKFFICLGNNYLVEGICPVNTVFSEIKKQCTKNLSHCIRNNQFRCVTEGRFGDFLNDNVYYICVRNNVSSFTRFKLQCQNGYRLNKTSVQCVWNKESIEATSKSESSKNNSDQSVSTAIANQSKKKVKSFKCKKEGVFADSTDCRRYFVCSKTEKDVFRQKSKKCDSDEIFNRDKKKCVDADSYECDHDS